MVKSKVACACAEYAPTRARARVNLNAQTRACARAAQQQVYYKYKTMMRWSAEKRAIEGEEKKNTKQPKITKFRRARYIYRV